MEGHAENWNNAVMRASEVRKTQTEKKTNEHHGATQRVDVSAMSAPADLRDLYSTASALRTHRWPIGLVIVKVV